MKAHLYEFIHPSPGGGGFAPTTSHVTLKTMLYIPRFKGVLFFSEVDAKNDDEERRKDPNYKRILILDQRQLKFSTDAKDVEQARECISGKEIRGKYSEIPVKGKYIGPVELPDGIVSKVVSAGKSMDQAKEKFIKSVKTLADLI